MHAVAFPEVTLRSRVNAAGAHVVDYRSTAWDDEAVHKARPSASFRLVGWVVEHTVGGGVVALLEVTGVADVEIILGSADGVQPAVAATTHMR
jgi:hypothetical protein